MFAFHGLKPNPVAEDFLLKQPSILSFCQSSFKPFTPTVALLRRKFFLFQENFVQYASGLMKQLITSFISVKTFLKIRPSAKYWRKLQSVCQRWRSDCFYSMRDRFFRQQNWAPRFCETCHTGYAKPMDLMREDHQRKSCYHGGRILFNNDPPIEQVGSSQLQKKRSAKKVHCFFREAKNDCERWCIACILPKHCILVWSTFFIGFLSTYVSLHPFHPIAISFYGDDPGNALFCCSPKSLSVSRNIFLFSTEMCEFCTLNVHPQLHAICQSSLIQLDIHFQHSMLRLANLPRLGPSKMMIFPTDTPFDPAQQFTSPCFLGPALSIYPQPLSLVLADSSFNEM